MNHASSLLAPVGRSISKALSLICQSNVLLAKARESNTKYLIALWSCYTILTAYLISNHVPWRDEAFVWLIAREVNWADILSESGANAAASLWYYLLAFPAKLGMPYWMMQLMHWVGACLAAGIFLRYAPFSILLKTVFIFSYYIAYEHAAISRVYMSTLLLMWACCAFYSKRFRRPLIYAVFVAFLANTSFFGLLAALFLGADYLISAGSRRNQLYWASLLIIISSGVVSGLGFIPRKDALDYYVNHFHFYRPENFYSILRFAFLMPGAESYFSKDLARLLIELAPWMTTIYTLLTIWLLLIWRAFSPAAFLVLAWAAISYVAIYKYAWPSPRHFSFCLTYTLMALWIGKIRTHSHKSKLELTVGLILVAAFSLGIIGTYQQSQLDLETPFSGSKKIAEYIIENNLEQQILVAQDIEFVAPILPYIPTASLWDPEKLKSVRYVYLNAGSRKRLRTTEVLEIIENNFSFDQPIYYIETLNDSNINDPRLEFLTSASGQKESYRLFKVTQRRMQDLKY